MKVIVERNALKDALQVVVARTKNRLDIPILEHVLVETDGDSIRLTGHDTQSCSQVSIPAEIERTGATALPGDHFAKLVSGFSEGAQVSIDANEKMAKIKAGRSSYQLQVLPAADFPEPLAPQDPTTLDLTAKHLLRLFKVPDAAISTEESRFYLCGIFLHVHNKRVAAAATNGHILIHAITDVASGPFTGIIVPDKACQEIVRLIGDAKQAGIEFSEALLAINVGGRRYVTKLINGTFPDYQRVIPQATAPIITVTTAEIDAALGRLAAACDRDKTPTAKLSWDDDVECLRASLRSDVANAGAEEIDCDSPGKQAGEIGAQIDYLRNVIAATGGKQARLYIDDPGSPIRIENPDDPDVVGVVMPCRV